MQIDANIRILPEPQTVNQIQSYDHIYNQFYKKYQQFDSILINQQTTQAVQKICQKALQESIYNHEDVCFFSFTNRRLNSNGNILNRRNSIKIEQEKSTIVLQQNQLIKYCFSQIKKRSEQGFQQKQNYIACSFIQIRKDIIKDIAKNFTNQKQTVLAYHNPQNHSKVSTYVINEVSQIQQILSRGIKLQEKNRNAKKNELSTTVFKLSLMQQGTQIVLCNILFVDLSTQTKAKQSFEQQGFFNKLHKLIFAREKLNLALQNKSIQFLEQYLKQPARICFIYYSVGWVAGQQNQNILQFINQLKKTRNKSQPNSLHQQEQTSAIIVKLNNRIAAIKSKIEAQKKQFRIKLRNIETLIGTDFDIQKILEKSNRNNQSNIFKKQRQAVDQIQTVLKVTQQQQRKIQQLKRQFQNLIKFNSSKQTQQFADLKLIKQQIINLEKQRKKMQICNVKKKIYIEQEQQNYLKKFKGERERVVDKLNDIGISLSKTATFHKIGYVNSTNITKKIDLKQHHQSTLAKYTQQYAKQVDQLVRQNERVIRLTENSMKRQLEQLELKLIKNPENNYRKNQKENLLQSLYKQYQMNAQFIRIFNKNKNIQLQKKYLRTDQNLHEENQLQINKQQFPILMELEGSPTQCQQILSKLKNLVFLQSNSKQMTIN